MIVSESMRHCMLLERFCLCSTVGFVVHVDVFYVFVFSLSLLYFSFELCRLLVLFLFSCCCYMDEI